MAVQASDSQTEVKSGSAGTFEEKGFSNTTSHAPEAVDGVVVPPKDVVGKILNLREPVNAEIPTNSRGAGEGPQHSKSGSEAETAGSSSTGDAKTDKLSSLPVLPGRLGKSAQPAQTTTSVPSQSVLHSLGDAQRPTPQVSIPRMSAGQPDEFLAQLTDRIQMQLRDGGGEIRIQLKPESLGRLEIRAESAAEGVVARIATESGDVKRFLEGNLQSLQQNLENQGLKVQRIEVTVQDGFDARQFTFDHGSDSSGSGQRCDTPQAGNMSDSRHSEDCDDAVIDAPALRILSPNSTFHTVA